VYKVELIHWQDNSHTVRLINLGTGYVLNLKTFTPLIDNKKYNENQKLLAESYANEVAYFLEITLEITNYK
jgi:hypothetical protein